MGLGVSLMAWSCVRDLCVDIPCLTLLCFAELHQFEAGPVRWKLCPERWALIVSSTLACRFL